ncbi:MAG: heterodisulfide reductase-related iron-sulfur binding cluster [Desulfobacterales bacterium]|nr:heterodisulfide reductase-related iron-sulfur binding cluster [Desulfobacterales bacterium]
MDRKELLDLQGKCIQEELPFCVARCPIHVDARGFLKQAGLGQWEEARKILDRVMPLSSILGRVCDHPCEAACKRGEAGDPVSISALERFCVESTHPQRKIPLFPPRRQQIALLGDGFDSLTAAWDLLRKGYPVTLFCPGGFLGQGLRDLAPGTLPDQAIEEELATLTGLGLKVFLHADIGSDVHKAPWKEADAVYVGLGGGGSRGSPAAVDFSTLESAQKGLFAAGLRDEEAGPSAVREAALGRKAGVSIDRYLQKTSLTAGREREGPCATRLYTSLSGVNALPRVPMENVSRGYTGEGARQEAGRCLQCECMECVKVCEYLERFKGHPRTYARDIYNSETAVTRNRRVNSLLNSCTLCGLCQEVCPHDFSMADLCLNGRRRIVEKGKMPPSAHEFAIQDMLFSNSSSFAFARNEPGMERSSHLFFPGCQLSGSAPDHVEKTYLHLRSRLAGGVGLLLGCCGAPAEWSGRTELFQAQLRRMTDDWANLGKPCLVTACSTCHSLLRKYHLEIPVLSLWEALEETGLPEDLPRRTLPQPLCIHDPCTARHEKRMQESVRRLLSQMGVQIRELALSGLLTECCGYGGLVSNADPDLAGNIARRRAQEDSLDYVAYYAMCRDSLAAAGKRVLHPLDLIWETSAGGDPAARKGPGYSKRHENRARLKRKLLLDIWKERPEEMQDYEKIILRIPPEVAERLENRRILVEDLQQVIAYAERAGRKLHDPQTGHWLAHHTPARVTYWVEYSFSEEAYTIHNAYSHRMKIVEENA